MTRTMRRAVLTAVRHFDLETVAVPAAEPGHVVMRVLASGICGSDLHTDLGENPVIRTPVAPGHEFSGVVAATGEGVDPGLEGRVVAARPSVPCGACRHCRAGREHLCDDMKFVGGLSYDGAFAEFVTLPASCLVPVSSDHSAAELAFAEPIAVAVHAAALPQEIRGRDVLVIGCGTIGLLVARVAALRGARVWATDLVDAKVRLAVDFGAAPARTAGGEGPARLETGDGTDFDVVFDCVGLNATLAVALRSVRKGGEVVLVGVPVEPIVLDPVDVLLGERRLTGCYIYTNGDFLEAVDLLLDRSVDVRPLISARMPLEEIGRAFEIGVTGNERVKFVL
ncbi:MAG: zinc-binding dehydrogenase [Chloroflexota bacterium]